MSSILVSALTALDAFLCVLVVVAACDYLRKVRPIDQPLLSIAFYLVAIGGFGGFITALQGHWVNPFGVMLHAGVVFYALARRGHVFS
ncbi:hypothetical protein [Pseudomonas putida]|uniref:Uncharacterized protein n=1 Tax=Pseudomonas putida TaxID=303 RepID=A0A2S3WFD5_PSEPU|nr:hypothetical protein [Pseudomonas putida]POF89652.1 hypothetical protein BGP80_17455 [Pseudomonas putida]